jgi:putative NIF3 family GTP cyclohydrolase 1 type 2
VINQSELVAKLDSFFNSPKFNEKVDLAYFPPGYASVLQRFLTPGFLQSVWNGLMMDNTAALDRVYLIVFPTPSVLDTIIAREVERGAPGALIFSHHFADYQESGPGFVAIPETHLEELHEHHISFYHCDAPLDCHTEISTSTALANALKVREQRRFSGETGVLGKIGPIGFNELVKKVCVAAELPSLRYSAIRHNGRAVQQVGIVAGIGGQPDIIREAIDQGCDTFITGEWWQFGPGEARAANREQIHEFLLSADVNLIGTSHYASEAVVMRGPLPEWFGENIPAVEPVFIAQEDPWR